MKAFGFILAFYIMLLSAVPCCAFDNCPDEKATTAQTGQHESGDDDNCGSCSPFFNCATCASVTIDLQQASAEPATTTLKKTYSDFIQPIIAKVHYDFWQPPRLSCKAT